MEMDKNGSRRKTKKRIRNNFLAYNESMVDQLITQFNALSGQKIPDEIQLIFKEIKERRSIGTLGSMDGYVAEDALIRVIPIDQLRRRAWILRNRYRYTVGEKVYDVYIKSNPPDPSTAKEAELRADLIHLLAENKRVETFRKSIEKTRYKIASITGFTSLVLLLIVLCVIYVKTRLYMDWSIELTPLMFVGVAGALGGSLGTTQKILSIRIWSESIEKLFEFQRSLISWLFIPPILGMLFAVTLFLLFAAGLMMGAPFPSINTVPAPPEFTAAFGDLSVPEKALAFLKYTAPVSAADYGKMIIWSFIAGFSQRFVPDTLSRLTKETESGKKKNE